MGRVSQIKSLFTAANNGYMLALAAGFGSWRVLILSV